MRSDTHAGEYAPSRPARQAVFEILTMSTLALLLVLIAAALPGGADSVTKAISLAPAAGATVLEHIGWVFGAYIPILLGFYAIVVGGSLVTDDAAAARTRRNLGTVAEVMVSALVPALVLILAMCIAKPSQAGVLLVIVPVSAVMFFLAVQLGGFIVFETALRLQSARDSREWSNRRLRLLRRRSRKPIWLVVALNAAVGTAVGVFVVFLTGSSQMAQLESIVVFGIFALGLAVLGVSAINIFYTSRDRLSRIGAWLMPAAGYLAVFAVALGLLASSDMGEAFGLIAVVSFSTMSLFWRRRNSPQLVINWTVKGAGTKSAARAVAKVLARNVKEIRELRPDEATVTPLPRWEKIIAGLKAFRAEL